MNAIILAAGEGRRLKKYTSDLPKGMLDVQGHSLIERQIALYREAGIKEIVIVRGYKGETINYPNVTYVENPLWNQTNMVASLLCARAAFDSDTLVSYADVIFSRALLQAVLTNPHAVAVAVDIDWQRYWKARYGRVDFDTESLTMDHEGRITSLGSDSPPLTEIDGRYVGVLKFSRDVLQRVVALYDTLQETHWDVPWQQSGKPFRQAYMTDLLQELIDHHEDVCAVRVQGGWLEFDTNEDYERQRDWLLP